MKFATECPSREVDIRRQRGIANQRRGRTRPALQIAYFGLFQNRLQPCGSSRRAANGKIYLLSSIRYVR